VNVVDKPQTPEDGHVRYRTQGRSRAESTRSRRSGRHQHRKLDAARLIKLLRKHSTLTLAVAVVLVSLLTGYVAIELGA
jgi:hypothetical protein